MKRDYYIIQSGRIKRQANTVYLEKHDGEKIPIPVNNINSLNIFGEIDINTKLLVFLSQQKIPIHFFNYYGFYSGTYYPKEYLNSGFLLVKQVEKYMNKEKRLEIAKEIINAASHNILKNLLHYNKQNKGVESIIERIEKERKSIPDAKDIEQLMGVEGRIRDTYYSSFDIFLKEGFEFGKRTRRPPENMLNCLISFGNSLMYTAVLSEIYRTQLNPTISFLHEPGERRFSLSLDISEIFKPIIVDKIIFKLINNRMINEKNFKKELNFCYLNDSGRKAFISEFDERMKTTIKHRKLKRSISYRTLIRIECYRLIKHILGEKDYEGFKAWW